ncbi:MAG: hypothetical protein HYZ66_09420, partial [Chlamydiae bacterium]|nr:hypothetical protein [Chlamydiota bacterium]
MSKKFLFAVFIFLIFGVSFSNAAEKKVIEGFDSPESIASDGKYVYVSNMGKELKATAKDGDGYVSRLSLAGEVLDKQFLPEKGMLNSPKGIAIVGHVLYVADVDHLIGFDLKTRQQVMDIDFSSEKTLFLNDVAV